MRLLLSASGQALLGDRLEAVAPGLELVVMDANGSCLLDGEVLEPADVQPDLVWLSLDNYLDDLLTQMFGVILDPSSTVQWIQTFNAGLDSPAWLWTAVLERGIQLCKGSAQAPPIAEYVLAHALSLIVPVERQRSLQADHDWQRTPFQEVSQTRWLLVGYGPIGQEIAQRLAPFGAHLTVVRRGPTAPGADDVTTLDHLPEVLPDADVVVLACASTDETRGLADAAFFLALRPGAMLINIARGDLIDEDALRGGLDRSQPATAVLDVTATEPLPSDHWLWDHPKVRLSAHTSSAGEGTPSRGAELFLENLRRFLADEPLLNEASSLAVPQGDG